MIFINFKTYPEATGTNAIKLAKICQKISTQQKIKIIIAPQTTDIFQITQNINIPVFGQHLDPVEPGRNTGKTTALALKTQKAKGVFLNHSENQFKKFSLLKKAISLAKRQNLETLVFAHDLASAKKIDKLNPSYIALEEPHLVSGDISMASVPKHQKSILKFAKSIKSFPLIGAGIKTKQDVIESLKLGVRGVGLASGFVKTPKPYQTLLSLAQGFL